VVVAGGVAAALGLAAVAVVEPRAVPDPAPAARGRALRDGGPARLRRLLRRPRRVVRQPVLAREPRPGRGHRTAAVAAPPEHDDPPAAAVLRLHALHRPVRVRGRGADHAARHGASLCPPGSSSGSASSSAPAGRGRSWGGAATGRGTPSRTRR
jgi:hypothetical protein